MADEGILLKQLAAKHRLRVRVDDGDNTHIIPGRRGHIYEHSDNVLGVMVMSDRALNAKWWSNRRRMLEAAECTVAQDGDREGAATFDPSNVAQLKAAMTACGVKRRRQPSAMELERLARIRPKPAK